MFQLLITAFDTGNPKIEVTEAVKINVVRNLNDPVFDTSSYQSGVYDYQPVGTAVLTVSAKDDDITVSILLTSSSIKELMVCLIC